ncbi:LysR family transcriptional regulator [Nocardioides sp. TF02-7]|uniref:LysR family transcriptional regulator n=1 Tax=Nocardioides sp. TF02-7 TaxID=2917724 RepID=UPI001F058FFB|nr:LysR family transcriptional regulator [Nocardioides sp. TF02-7]UMG92486.1 LysR family transcriptional regulator [Nocardioides sp. TF02-7]
MAPTAWRTFLEVCRLGSLSAAAAELGYTQSAVSRQVAALERAAGVPLLERRPRGVVPTPAGEAFRHHARVVVNEAARAVRAAREAGAGARRLAVGATPSTAAGLVPGAVRRVLGSRPDLRWTLDTGLTATLEERVLAGELDVAVVTDAPPGLRPVPHLVRQPVGVDEMCVVVPPGHPATAVGNRVPLTAFATATWVEDDEGSAALLRTAAHRAGFEPDVDHAAPDLTGKTAMVAAGHAVALVPGVLVPVLRADVAVVRLLDPPTRGIHVTRPASLPPTVGGLVESVVTALVEELGAT